MFLSILRRWTGLEQMDMESQRVTSRFTLGRMTVKLVCEYRTHNCIDKVCRWEVSKHRSVFYWWQVVMFLSTGKVLEHQMELGG